jgi:hypothetical protein
MKERASAAGAEERRSRLLSTLVLISLGAGLFVLGFAISSALIRTPAEEPATVARVSDTSPTPVFTRPEAKLAELSDPAFTDKLFAESTALEPALKTSGTQVHMGFWSGPGNHGSLVRLLDAVNSYKAKDGTIHKAIWDEGVTSSLQIPSFVTMNREAWYERAYPTDGKTVVYGVEYVDPSPVTTGQADAIWGEYSRRYTGQAALIRQATGKPVEVWCFVQGAKAKRIFYTNEFVELKRLEAEGAVKVHFAKSSDADWTDPSDWTHGTANHPAAIP